MGSSPPQPVGGSALEQHSATALTPTGVPPLRIALVHDFLVHMRGAERFLVLLGEIFPTADLYLLVHDRKVLPAALKDRRIVRSFVDRIPFSQRTFRAWLPLYPYAVERFDLDQYDLVISSSMGFAHGVITQAATCHICCCHTPFRYAWSWYHRHLAQQHGPAALVSQLFLHSMRNWERQAAGSVDYFVANSTLTQQRIRKYYRREAEVLHYPIDAHSFQIAEHIEEYYLIVSALMPYKRVDIAVDAFNKLGLPLKVIGTGPDLPKLRASARPNVEFLGALSDRDVRLAYARCRAFIMTAEEDYGLTPLEAQASGRPVIAYGSGGALETVREGVTGTFFRHQTSDALVAAVAQFDPAQFDSMAIRDHAMAFDVSVFRTQLLALVRSRLAAHQRAYGPPPLSGGERPATER